MARIITVLLMLMLWACAHGTIKPDTHAVAANSKLASRVVSYASGHMCELETLRCYTTTWRGSGYSRLSDTVAPDYVVLAGDGTACPVFGLLVTPPQRDRYWQCAEQWRNKQVTHN